MHYLKIEEHQIKEEIFKLPETSKNKIQMQMIGNKSAISPLKRNTKNSKAL